MENKKDLSVSSRKNSFGYAIQGIVQVFRKEPNAKIHGLATVFVIVAGIVRDITPTRWAVLALAIGIMWVAEMLNTCIEELANFACDNKLHPAIKSIKDMAAGAVLVAAMVSVVIGVIVFCF
jgi:diacylglycerol kinase (ATP)